MRSSSGDIVYAGNNSVTFLYGRTDCNPSSDRGCPPPVQIQVRPACLVPPGIFAEESVAEEPGPSETGALTQLMSDGHLRIWTGSINVAFFDLTRESVRPSEAFDALQPLNEPAGAIESWPPPEVPTGCPRQLLDDPIPLPNLASPE